MTEHETPKRSRLIPRRYKLLIFVLLIIASNVVRHQQGRTARPEPHHHVVSLPVFDQGEPSSDRVEMVYQEMVPVDQPDASVIVLLHGSPMRSYDLQSLADILGKSFRVVAPELPGFGRSTRKIPDYSVVAHAAYVDQMLAGMAVSNVHLVAYSQGGGVAFELYRRAPKKIKSITLISSIGVQEFELLGNYRLNRAIHGVQLGLIGSLAVLTPHFGWLDGMMLNTAYARNFYDSDLRPFRKFLSEYPGPMLVIQGRKDFLVPPGAAMETHRLVPQSELIMKPGGHIFVFTEPDVVAQDVEVFIDRVEQGAALSKDHADDARIQKALQPFDPREVDQAVGVAMLIMIMMIALSSFISEDLACIGAGLLVTQGVIDYFTAAAGAFLGIFVGDLLLYWAGHHWGKAALKRAPLRWMIKETSIRDSSKWFAQKGPVVILLSRFVPGSRLPTYFTAGMLHTKFWQFFLYFLFAGLIWAPLLVWLAMKIGQEIIETLFAYKLYTLVVITTTVLLLWLLFKIIIPMFSFKGRRLLLSKWRRLSRWEFWPFWLFYPPVIIYILYLGLRHRCLMLFTLSNPSIHLSGVLGESKREILDGLKARRDLIARYDVIPAHMPAAEKEQAVISFLDHNKMTFPVVLKPDYGQRGMGVAVIRNIQAVQRYFETPRPATIVQEYAPGFEFGVFYYRLPGQPRGHVFSITEKRFPTVTGNGKHDLEHLILKDPRTVCMAPYYLRLMDERRFTVPGDEETVQLVELGTHCRGAVFHDGRWIKTIEMERTIDEICQGFEGFYFGRFDIRANSLDEFRLGRGFKVIELNGVTSESTNIYDPGNGLFNAYAVLFRQWRIAFKIGDRNRRLGMKPCTVMEFLKLIAEYESAPEA